MPCTMKCDGTAVGKSDGTSLGNYDGAALGKCDGAALGTLGSIVLTRPDGNLPGPLGGSTLDKGGWNQYRKV